MAKPDDVLERMRILQQQDWKRITLQLLKYTARRFLGVDHTDGDNAEEGVRGVSIEDFVQEAIETVWLPEGEGRNWDHEKIPLIVFLQGVVSSKISNFWGLHEVKKVETWPDGGEEEAPAEDKMMARHADPSHNHARYLVRRPRTPEEIADEQEEIERCHDLLLEAAGDDEELIRYLDSLDRGLETPSDIARDWGVEPKVIYNAETRLKGRLKAMRKRAKGEPEIRL